MTATLCITIGGVSILYSEYRRVFDPARCLVTVGPAVARMFVEAMRTGQVVTVNGAAFNVEYVCSIPGGTLEVQLERKQ
jgi:hypothetical protein